MWPFKRKKNEAVEYDEVLRQTNVAAGELGHNYIGTEHLLCALVQMSDPCIEGLFRKCLIRIEDVRRAIAEIEGTGAHSSTLGDRPKTPRLKKVLLLADEERWQFRHLTLPQSLLLAIVVEGGGIAAGALRSLDIDMEKLRNELETPSQ